MSFKMVLRSLQEVFPQVDCRILKAVAIEHSKDVDAAVEFVLLEVLPALSEPAEAFNPVSDTQETESSTAEVKIQDTSLENQGAKEENANQSGTSPVVEGDKSNSLPHNQIAKDALMSSPPGSIRLECIWTPFDAGNTVEQVASVEHISRTFQPSDGNSGGGVHAYFPEFNETDASQNVAKVCTSAHNPPYVEDMNLLIELEEPLLRGLSQPEDTSNLMWCGSSSDKINQKCLSVSDEEYSKGISENGSEMVDHSSSTSEKPTQEATQSGNVVRMDTLEEFIIDAKSNKETLLSALESICNMIKDVEVQEHRAKLAKEEALGEGHEFLIWAEDIKQMVSDAKGANEMRAEEILGEKAMLAAEARELQSRLLNLSEQKEKSLSIVQEIQQTLEARLAAALESQNAADQEKRERKEEARKIHNDQKLIMDEVEQESKRLEQEAEENAKLREFLVHRGGIVDKLLGEMAVVCEDVLQLKERVDGHVPSNKSPALTRSLTSSSSSLSNHGGFLSDTNLLPEELGENLKACGESNANSDKNIDAGEGDTNLLPEELGENVKACGESNANSDKNIDAGEGDKGISDDDWELF